MSKTTLLNPQTINPEWFVIDADGLVVGRLATRLAMVLMGKHKPTYTPHVDTGDYVIVTNAERIRFGGRAMASGDHPYFTDKMLKKEYQYYTRHPGGLKTLTAAQLFVKHPEKIIELAVRRMLPKSALGGQMLGKLKIYTGPNHPHQSQQPTPLKLDGRFLVAAEAVAAK